MSPIQLGFATDVGRMRERNEDHLAIFAPFPGEPNPSGLDGMLLVADGMGGEQGGDLASRHVCDRFRAWLTSGAYRESPEFGADEALGRAIAAEFRRVSEEVRRLGVDDPRLAGIGTTVVLVVFAEDMATVAHVGDSRCYRVRQGEIERLTVDHSWVERQVAEGLLTPERAATHPQRNVLTRSMGDRRPATPDVRRESVRVGDTFILCSDGLTGRVEDAEILAAASEDAAPQEVAERLVARANEVDGSDNITVVVGRCVGEPAEATGRHAATVRGPSPDPAETNPELTRPELFVRPRPRWWIGPLVVLAGAAGFGGGYLLGDGRATPPSPGDVEAEATALMAEGERAEAREELLSAIEAYRRANAVFREAPLAREAQSRAQALERRLAGRAPGEATGEGAPELESDEPPAGEAEGSSEDPEHETTIPIAE